MNENDKLFEYIGQTLYNPEAYTSLNIDDFSEENKKLATGISYAMEKIHEFYNITLEISSGNIDVEIPDNNPLASPLKDLRSSLKHLTWQAKEIANGNLNQHIDFLGDFSTSFNYLIGELKKKRKLQERNLKIQKTLAREKLMFEKERGKAKLLEKQLEMQVLHYKEINESNKKIRQFRHDIVNHLVCLDALLEDNNVDEARKYLENTNKLIKSSKLKTIDTGNAIFDAIFSEKQRECTQKGINLNAKVQIYPSLKIDNVDWCILFGNIFDNAIRATFELPDTIEKQIDFSVTSDGDMLDVLIENPIIDEPKKDGEFFKTTKNDEENHGIGLSNVSKIVEKYDGIININTSNKTFSLSFVLFDVF